MKAKKLRSGRLLVEELLVSSRAVRTRLYTAPYLFFKHFILCLIGAIGWFLLSTSDGVKGECLSMKRQTFTHFCLAQLGSNLVGLRQQRLGFLSFFFAARLTFGSRDFCPAHFYVLWYWPTHFYAVRRRRLYSRFEPLRWNLRSLDRIEQCRLHNHKQKFDINTLTIEIYFLHFVIRPLLSLIVWYHFRHKKLSQSTRPTSNSLLYDIVLTQSNCSTTTYTSETIPYSKNVTNIFLRQARSFQICILCSCLNNFTLWVNVKINMQTTPNTTMNILFYLNTNLVQHMKINNLPSRILTFNKTTFVPLHPTFYLTRSSPIRYDLLRTKHCQMLQTLRYQSKHRMTIYDQYTILLKCNQQTFTYMSKVCSYWTNSTNTFVLLLRPFHIRILCLCTAAKCLNKPLFICLKNTYGFHIKYDTSRNSKNHNDLMRRKKCLSLFLNCYDDHG